MPQIIPIKDLKNSPEKMIEYLSYVLKNSLQSVLSGATAK